MVDVMAQVDHAHEPIVAFPDRKIGRRGNGRSCPLAGLGPFPKIAQIDPFFPGPACTQPHAAGKLIRMILIVDQHLVFELL